MRPPLPHRRPTAWSPIPAAPPCRRLDRARGMPRANRIELRSATMMVRTIGARRSRGLAQFAAGLALVAAGLVLDGAAPARAEGPWCASVTGPDGGYVLCNYASWD